MKINKLNQENRLHNSPYPVIGLTGGIATGKSTVSQYLKDHGENVICADELVHEIYSTEETFEFVSSVAQEAIADHQILFPKLRELFFNDKELQNKIETYIYSRLPRAFKKKYEEFNNPDFIFYDVPLLFEKNLNPLVDLITVVYSTPENQLKRLIQRDGIKEELAKNILQKQMPIDEKKQKADYVIENNTNLTDLYQSIDHFLKEIRR